MKAARIHWMAVPLFTAVLLIAATARTTDTVPEDEAAIRAVVQLYFDGIIKYDEAALRKAFHSEAYIIGLDKAGHLERVPFQEWVLYTRGQAPDPTGRNNSVVSIDVTRTAAVVKTDLNWPHVRYIDYLSLMKIDGEWRIVNKVFHRGEPESR